MKPGSDLVPVTLAAPELVSTAAQPVADFVALWLAQVAPSSARSYRTALADFARLLAVDVDRAVAELFSGPQQAAVLAQRWRANMLERQLAPKTINARLAALRSLVRYAAEGLLAISWRLMIRDVRAEKMRDTRGPGTGGFSRLHAAAREDGPASARDSAIVRLLYSMALRRAEVAGLDLAHVEAAGPELAAAKGARLLVLAKGRREREGLTMPSLVRHDLSVWIAERGLQPGPLFVSIDRWGHKGGRLPVDGINGIVRRLAAKAGMGHARPHGLRHAAITEACRQTNGNVRLVQEFSRHVNIQTVLLYIDSLLDEGGEVAELVDGAGCAANEEAE